jgi:hypothetical protein
MGQRSLVEGSVRGTFAALQLLDNVDLMTVAVALEPMRRSLNLE